MENVRIFFDENKSQQVMYQLILMLIQLAFLILGLISKHSFAICSLVICATAVLLGVFTFEFIEYKKSLKQFRFMVWTVVFGLTEIISGITIKYLGYYGCALVGLVLTMCAITYAYPSKKNVEAQKKIKDFLEDSRYKDKSGLAHGDTALGTIVETGRPNVVPYKDRFLHFLVLGPTGSGKTSQSLLPMVERDMHYEDIGIVCLEPKGDFAEKVYALALIYNRPDIIYFNPTLRGCPYFNPLRGDMNDVIESVTTAFSSMDGDSKQYFKDMNRNLMASGVTVVKTIYGDKATLVDLNTLFTNRIEALKMIKKFNNTPCSTRGEKSQHDEIAQWFTSDYFASSGGKQSKTFENSSGVRTQLSNLISNAYLRKVLNPYEGGLPNYNIREELSLAGITMEDHLMTVKEYKDDGSPVYMTDEDLPNSRYINFEKVLEDGAVLTMCSAQGALRDLGKTLGMFLIQSFEAAVFRRPGDEDTRRGVIFYVDEFQKYANKGYDDLLTQGRSYRVSSVLATQARSGIAINSGALGKTLTDLVSTNCRNKIIYPGGSYDDAAYYSKEFGTKTETSEKISISRGRGVLSRWNIDDQRESVSTVTEEVPLFTPSAIMKRPFGEAVSQVVVKDTVQDAKVVQLSFIDKEINDRVKKIINEEIRPRATKGYDEALEYDVTSDEKEFDTVGEYQNPTLGNHGDFADEFDEEEENDNF